MATSSEGTPPIQAEYQPGEFLFNEGAPAEQMYIINSGHVRIVRRVFREEVVVETLGKGNICGDIAFAAGASYPVSAIAMDTVQVVVVERENIQNVMFGNPKVVARMASRLAARLTHAHFRLSNFALRSDVGRLMLQLRHEVERNGSMEGDVYVAIPYDLPETLATERGSIDEGLRRLIQDGLIETDGAGRFKISDLSAFDRKLTYIELADRFGDRVSS